MRKKVSHLFKNYIGYKLPTFPDFAKYISNFNFTNKNNPKMKLGFDRYMETKFLTHYKMFTLCYLK